MPVVKQVQFADQRLHAFFYRCLDLDAIQHILVRFLCYDWIFHALTPFQRDNRRTSKERGACAAPTSSSLVDIDAVN